MNELVQAFRRALAKAGIRVRNKLVWGYGSCEDTIKLHNYYYGIHLLRNQELVGEKCLCQEEIDRIVSAAQGLLGPECKTGEYDFSRETRTDAGDFILKNPYCVAYDYAADYLAAQCSRIGINFKVIEQKCSDIGIDLKITDRVVCDAIGIALTLEEQKCDVDVQTTLYLQECIVDLQTILTQVKCDIDLQTYIQLRDCGASVDLIVSQLNCGATVETILNNVDACFSDDEGEVELVLSDFTVETDDTTICYFLDIEVSLSNEAWPTAEYSWDFGSGAVPSDTTGFGPITVHWTTSGVKTITVTATVGEQEIVNTLNVTVSVCTGNIAGTVRNIFGGALQSVNLKLYRDTDLDGVADDATIIKNTNTTSGGLWSMTSITPGSYVIVVSPVNGYTLVSGIDTTDDLDLVVDVDSTDVIIPVTVKPSELDANNAFIFSPNDGVVSGNVQDDLGNPIEGATVNVYNDDNADGVSDGTLEGSGVTDENGDYIITGLYTAYNISVLTAPKSHYVIVLDVPIGYTILSGIDISEDLDTVPNTDTTDNIIPCTLIPGEVDADNNFVIQAV